jgi:hypothetical protein
MLAQVEYVGVTTNEAAREYTLYVRRDGGCTSFTVAISNEAFLAHRVRYQDGPGVCFLKLQRELAAADGAMPSAYLNVSDEELEAFRVAHAPKPPQRRPRPPLPT